MTDLPEPAVAEVLAIAAELAEARRHLDALAQQYGPLTPAAVTLDAAVTLLIGAAGIEASGPA